MLFLYITFFSFNDTATTEIYTLSLHDALPILQRYHDVISSFGGKTSYDADNRPLLVMRSNLWASGYDVDGTDQTSLGKECRSEERFSRNAETDLVCRLLLEKKK